MERVDMHRLQELVRLHRMGTGCRAAARMLGMSPNTERVYRAALIAAGLWDGAVDALPALDDLRRAVEARCPTKAHRHSSAAASRRREGKQLEQRLRRAAFEGSAKGIEIDE